MKETLHNLAAGLHNRLLDNELDAEGLRWLADHRSACPACDARFVRMERLVGALAAEVANHPAKPRWKPASFFRRFAAGE